MLDIQWIDRFVQEIKEYIYVREEDNLLILMPVEAYHLNQTALLILKNLIQGMKISTLLEIIGDDEQKRRDIYYFFCDLRCLLRGCLRDTEERKTIEYIYQRRPNNILPVLSEIALTYDCNLDCIFCYADSGCSGQKKKKAGK